MTDTPLAAMAGLAMTRQPNTPAPSWTPRPRRRATVRLWLPLTPILWILSPFPLLLAPLGYLVPPKLRPDPFFLVFTLGELLLSLSGTVVDVDAPDALVQIRIL